MIEPRLEYVDGDWRISRHQTLRHHSGFVRMIGNPVLGLLEAVCRHSEFSAGRLEGDLARPIDNVIRHHDWLVTVIGEFQSHGQHIGVGFVELCISLNDIRNAVHDTL